MVSLSIYLSREPNQDWRDNMEFDIHEATALLAIHEAAQGGDRIHPDATTTTASTVARAAGQHPHVVADLLDRLGVFTLGSGYRRDVAQLRAAVAEHVESAAQQVESKALWTPGACSDWTSNRTTWTASATLPSVTTPSPANPRRRASSNCQPVQCYPSQLEGPRWGSVGSLLTSAPPFNQPDWREHGRRESANPIAHCIIPTGVRRHHRLRPRRRLDVGQGWACDGEFMRLSAGTISMAVVAAVIMLTFGLLLVDRNAAGNSGEGITQPPAPDGGGQPLAPSNPVAQSGTARLFAGFTNTPSGAHTFTFLQQDGLRFDAPWSTVRGADVHVTMPSPLTSWTNPGPCASGVQQCGHLAVAFPATGGPPGRPELWILNAGVEMPIDAAGWVSQHGALTLSGEPYHVILSRAGDVAAGSTLTLIWRAWDGRGAPDLPLP